MTPHYHCPRCGKVLDDITGAGAYPGVLGGCLVCKKGVRASTFGGQPEMFGTILVDGSTGYLIVKDGD